MKTKISAIRSVVVAIAAVAACWSDVPAYADTATSNMTVSASINNSCTISAGSLTFGAYDPVVANASSGADLDATATLSVACTSGASTTITLGQGSNPGGGSTDAAPERQMASGSDRLAYSLWQDPGFGTVWGNTQLTGKSYTGTGASENVTVHGKIAKGQNMPAGSYSDTVVATITF